MDATMVDATVTAGEPEAAPGKRARVTGKDPATKLAHRRLSVLERAEPLRNVAEACRRSGLDRTSFYEWKRRFQTRGFTGLFDRSPVAKPHLQAMPRRWSRGSSAYRWSSRPEAAVASHAA